MEEVDGLRKEAPLLLSANELTLEDVADLLYAATLTVWETWKNPLWSKRHLWGIDRWLRRIRRRGFDVVDRLVLWTSGPATTRLRQLRDYYDGALTEPLLLGLLAILGPFCRRSTEEMTKRECLDCGALLLQFYHERSHLSGERRA